MKKSYSILPISEWGIKINHLPLIIAGPCSAESFEQTYKTAKLLSAEKKISVFRAGAWKPRTQPNDFEGIGKDALKWLQIVKKDFKLSCAVEVLSPQQVELCLKHDIDVLWLGTRTVSNPYSVQQIANALKGTHTIVLIKNPMNPDLKLWLGAIERIYKSGIKKMAAVHRGFYPFEYTHLRNLPKWELVIDLRTLHPEIPVICDPSHIAGHTKYVGKIAQKALDLCYDGLMIESHINPTVALSDAQQQLTPQKLNKLLNNLTYCHKQGDIEHLELIRLREKVDSIDNQLIELLSQRMEVVRQMAHYKKNNNIPILQLKRWKEIIDTRLKKAEELNLNDDFIKLLLEAIHLEAIRVQSEEKK
ncbi:MAG: bifunctional 3-deoxy-7-phosphoheptulonate synthase/chorismate mutase type II [Bacteroidales bacterium]